MRIIGTRTTAVAFSALATLLAAAGLALACTPQQYISSISPASAPAGTKVLVEGQAASPGMVELLWDGPQGQKIGEALPGPNGRFSIVAEIPASASPDVYSMAASSGSAAVARSAFEVTAPGSSNTEKDLSSASQGSSDNAVADLWTGFSGESATGQSGVAPNGDPTKSSPLLPAGLVLLTAGLATSAATLVLASRRKSGAFRS